VRVLQRKEGQGSITAEFAEKIKSVEIFPLDRESWRIRPERMNFFSGKKFSAAHNLYMEKKGRKVPE
jgi:hypothetical protein